MLLNHSFPHWLSHCNSRVVVEGVSSLSIQQQPCAGLPGRYGWQDLSYTQHRKVTWRLKHNIPGQEFRPIFFITHHFILQAWNFLKIIWSTCIMTTCWHELPFEPFIICLSCNKWSCGTYMYQNCWKGWNGLIWQRCLRESACCQSTYMWDSINCVISAEWQTQNYDHVFQILQILRTFQVNNFHVTMHT